MKKQQEIFNEWKILGTKVGDLGVYVQNDFDRMLKDGYATKKQIKENIQNFKDLVYINIQEIKNLSEISTELMRKKVK